MDGLEAVEVRFSELERTRRVDSEFFLKEYVDAKKTLFARAVEPVPQVADVSDGNHLKISDSFTNDGVPYYRGQDANHFFIEQSEPVNIVEAVYHSANMKRSHLKSGDVLLSIVGTIGGVSLVGTNQPATCSCKLAILRPQAVKPGYLAAYLHSRYGQYQIQRFTRGAVQMGLILEDLDQIFLPKQSNDFETMIETIVQKSKTTLDESQSLHQGAENILLEHLGLKDWQPSKANVSVKSFADAFEAERLDPEFYQPKFDELEDIISAKENVQPLCEFLTVNARGKQPSYEDDGVLVVNSKHVRTGKVIITDNRRATLEKGALIIRKGDVLINGTGVGTIGRCAPYFHDEIALPDNHVTVLRTNELDPVYLSVYLNSPAGQLQVDKHYKGSSGQIELYPDQIANFYVWKAPIDVQKQIRAKVEASYEAEQLSEQLLDLAKRGVELAIEKSETAALAWIEAELAERGLDLTAG